MSNQAPNLQDSHFLVDSSAGMTVLPAHKHRTYFMLINHDQQEIEIHMGPGSVTDGEGIIIPAGGHLTLSNGVFGPVQILEGSGGSARITVISPLDEETLATIEPNP